MRHGSLLIGIILVLASSAGAQVNSESSLLLGYPMPRFAAPAPLANAAIAIPSANALALSAPAEPEPPQGVYGVFQNFDWQAYAGFTSLRFYEIPGVTGTLDGFNLSLVYYPKGGHWAADGEFVAAFAPRAGAETALEAGMGGARYRTDGPMGLELWVHGMVGGAHYTPQTAYGGENAFAFAVGGGADYTPHHKRLGYRAQFDMLGTRFFGTHQYNPKFSIGIVYKF